MSHIFQTSVLIMECMDLTDCVNISKRSEAANQPFLYWIEWNTSLSLWLSVRLNRFQEQWKFLWKNKAFEESSKCRGVFRTNASIYDGAFLWVYLSALYFRNISSIIDLRLGYIWASENIDIFKVKLRWSKSSRLLQRIAFLVFELT